jgi:hypothetical protein
MSELPAQRLGYQDVVTEYFLGLRGAGLLVSPLDREVVAEWERRGLPVAVVCRGIKSAVEALAPRAPRSLRAVRGWVEDEWRAYRSGRVGEGEAPPGEAEAAQARLAAARARLADAERAGGPLAPAYRAARERLALEPGRGEPGGGARSPLEQLDAALAAADDALLAGWLAALPRPERAALGARLRLLAGARPWGGSRRGRRAELRAHLFDLAGRAGLSCLRGTV